MAEQDPLSQLEPGVGPAALGRVAEAAALSSAISLRRLADTVALPTIPNLSPEQVAELEAAMKSGGGGQLVIVPPTADERIATALEKIADFLTGTDGLDAFFFTQAAYEAGRAFARGRG